MGKHSDLAREAMATHRARAKELLPLEYQRALDDVMAQAVRGETQTTFRAAYAVLHGDLAIALTNDGYRVDDDGGVLRIFWDGDDVTTVEQ